MVQSNSNEEFCDLVEAAELVLKSQITRDGQLWKVILHYLYLENNFIQLIASDYFRVIGTEKEAQLLKLTIQVC